MKKISNFITHHSLFIVVFSLLLLIPVVIGYINTKINYDILVYLPEDIETIKGQDILTKEFGIGAFSFVMVDEDLSYNLIELQDRIKKIEGVNQTFSIANVTDTTIPISILPQEVLNKVYQDGRTAIVVTFCKGTSEEETINAIKTLRKVVKNESNVSGMTAMVLDTMELSNQEILAYLIIAIALCIAVLCFATDSYLIPIFLLGNIGIAIIYNLGTNVFLGQISYITKAITAVLQLGVTMDFSIFLYHKYEQTKQQIEDKKIAMSVAIQETFKSVIGSSLTTIAGFLALCTMDLTLGKDIGIVMAKGVIWGLICVLTLFPSLLLVFDKQIEKTKHRIFLPKFQKVQQFTIKHNKLILVLFFILLIPAIYGYKHYQVYYKLDESLPEDLPSSIANRELSDKFGITSPQIILVRKDLKKNDLMSLVSELKEINGVDFVLAPGGMSNDLEMILPDELANIFKSDNYQLILVNSNYEVASNELNHQIDIINDCVKKYDKNAIIAGEGALTKDLVEIADHDFIMVNYISVAVIFILMLVVLKSISLPIILVLAIEFAIFVNMAVAYYMGTKLPFIAPIVVGTIQLGATIDYAILMSTKYLENREKIIDKYEAIKITLEKTIISIVVSALCFFAATFGVAIYSKIDMIASICTLLSRGAIISMLVVIFILPVLLLVFDKFIITFTKGMKGIDKKMKKINKLVNCFLILIVLFFPMNIFAMGKTETIYTNLDHTGKPYNTIVTNHLPLITGSDVKDETELKNILNINGKEKFIQNGNELLWKNAGKDIFYNGITEKKLPIDIDIKYYLNDKELKIDDIISKKGRVKIVLNLKNNDKNMVMINNKNEVLYTPFVVTLGTIFDNVDNKNIEISNGKVINTGTRTMVFALASPGLFDSINYDKFRNLDTITISYDTTSFSLNTIYLVTTPKLLDNSDFAMFDKLNDIYGNTLLLQENMNQLENGAKELENGINQLLDGTLTINTNLEKILDALCLLSDASINVDQGMEILLSKLKEVNDSLDVTEIQNTFIALNNLKQKNTAKINELNSKPNITTTDQDLIRLLTENNFVLDQIIVKFTDLSSQLGDLKNSIDEVIKLKSGTLAIASGLNEVKSGVNSLYQGSASLIDGANKLSTGVTTLSVGTTQFNNQGIRKLSGMAYNFKSYGDRVEALMELSHNYSGFASSNSSNTTFISMVQSLKSKKK